MTHHYVCLGLGACGMLLGEPGVCITEECPRRGQPLAECDCTDAQHKSAVPPEAQKEEMMR